MITRRFICISIACIMAAAGNVFLNTLTVDVLKLPVYLDTVFTSAVCFAFGLVPGLVTVALTYTAIHVYQGFLLPFIICMIAEVLLIWRFNPLQQKHGRVFFPFVKGKSLTSFTGLFSGLMFLYICACITISVLGGIIDFVYHGIFASPKPIVSAEDIIKINLHQSGIPVLLMNILSRLPINLVDRFIVVFGGFGISLGLRALIKPAGKNSQN